MEIPDKMFQFHWLSVPVLATAFSFMPSLIAQSPTINEFAVPASSTGPGVIITGPDGALWFTDQGGNKIGRITTSGSVTDYPTPTASSQPYSLTLGPDGALWFTEFDSNADKIGRITTSGSVTEFPILYPTSAQPGGLTIGPDGALWFTEAGVPLIGRITTSGSISEYPLDTSEVSAKCWETQTGCATWAEFITLGPDDVLWFTESLGNKIGRITTSGSVTEYLVPTPNAGLTHIATGPDGALWFAEHYANKIGRITTSGSVTEFLLPTPGAGPAQITVGPDGAVWFTEFDGNKIGRITTSGSITEYPLPTGNSGPGGITIGPDGALWFTEHNANKVARFTISSFTPGIQPNGIVNAANFKVEALSPGAWFTIFGQNLGSAAQWTSADTVILGGATVTVCGLKSAMSYNSGPVITSGTAQWQLNALMPDGVAGQVSCPVVVIVNGQASPSANITVASSVMELFQFKASSELLPIVTHSDYSLVGPSNAGLTPAKKGEVVIAWGTGDCTPPVITVGDAGAQVIFSGRVSPGLCQINFLVPLGATGASPLTISTSTGPYTLWVTP